MTAAGVVACTGTREPVDAAAERPSTRDAAREARVRDAGQNGTRTRADATLRTETSDTNAGDTSISDTHAANPTPTPLFDASLPFDAATGGHDSFESMPHDAGQVGGTTTTRPVTSSKHETTNPTSSTPLDCELEPALNLSPVIGTVGILTLATKQTQIKRGRVEFGPDESYSMTAPLELNAANFRTLLLGMTPETAYHYRVVLESDTGSCTTAERTFVTGRAPDNVMRPKLTSAAATLAPGYVVTSVFGAVGADNYVMIYNHRGEVVWWFRANVGAISRARLAWDGKFMYARDANPTGAPGGRVVRVSMDGSRVESIVVDTGHHDMAVTPNNGLLFLTGGGRDGCGTITRLGPNGQLSAFYDLRDAFHNAFRHAATDPCHCNSIDYNTDDRSVSVSCLGQNAYVKLTDTAELLWVLGGNNGQSDFTGDVAWLRQHGHHFTSPTRVVFYNNNGGGDATARSSIAVELELDLQKRTATRVWQYVGGETSTTLGDVQRLPNGNTLITYSNAATLREVTPELEEVQSWVFDRGVGYSEHLTSLYGAAFQQ